MGPLQFFALRPGAPRAEVEARLADLGGGWRCASSRIDPRFTECRGTVHPEGEPALTVTGSLVDGSAAVLILAAPVDEARLRRWVADLSSRYGEVTPRAANGQLMWQWVRQQRMIRLTTRIEGKDRMVSVSLVDGPLLDGLNRGPE